MYISVAFIWMVTLTNFIKIHKLESPCRLHLVHITGQIPVYTSSSYDHLPVPPFELWLKLCKESSLTQTFPWTTASTFGINQLDFSFVFKLSQATTQSLIRELKQPRRRPQRRLQGNNRFNDQNNSSARESRFLVHFFDVHCTTTTWNLLIWRFMEDVNILRRISLHLFSLNKILKNSTPGKVACMWHTERIQIDAIKFERTQIVFFFYLRFHCRRRRRRPCFKSLFIWMDTSMKLHIALMVRW